MRSSNANPVLRPGVVVVADFEAVVHGPADRLLKWGTGGEKYLGRIGNFGCEGLHPHR